jgi:hypothetical protein
MADMGQADYCRQKAKTCCQWAVHAPTREEQAVQDCLALIWLKAAMHYENDLPRLPPAPALPDNSSAGGDRDLAGRKLGPVELNSGEIKATFDRIEMQLRSVHAGLVATDSKAELIRNKATADHTDHKGDPAVPRHLLDTLEALPTGTTVVFCFSDLSSSQAFRRQRSTHSIDVAKLKQAAEGCRCSFAFARDQGTASFTKT